MPLEKAKPGTPGFSRNIATEIKAGKPQKQAVAIAYEKAREARKDASDCITEKNGEYFVNVPGSREPRGPFATKDEAEGLARNALDRGTGRSDAGEAILGEPRGDSNPLDRAMSAADALYSKALGSAHGDAEASGFKHGDRVVYKKTGEVFTVASTHNGDVYVKENPSFRFHPTNLRKDAERDLPGPGTTEGNYGIDTK